MASESLDKDTTHGAVPFGFLADADNDLFEVSDGVPAAIAIQKASMLEAASRELLTKSLEGGGFSAHQAELCTFAMEAAEALRLSAGRGGEPTKCEVPDTEVFGGDLAYSFDDMRPSCGVARSKTEWHKTDLHWCEAESLGGVEAALRGIASIADLLAVDSYARVMGRDCLGKFQVLDDDVQQGMYAALQRLVESALGELDNALERLTPKSPSAGVNA